jgi:tRNA pseudouridine55 synthase
MSQEKQNQPAGVLLVDKPSGITSHDVVDRVRRIFRMKKVGHAGTLDPMATGLLIILVGKATKISQYLMSLDKEYKGTFHLGQATDSHDADGEVVSEAPVPPDLDEVSLKEFSDTFIGDQYQIPPMFSAKKVDGQPLYKLARKGKTIEREPRFVRVANFELSNVVLPDANFTLNCSKGTYVRTIIHDLGEKIGCGGHLTALRRTAIDRFRVEESNSLEVLKELPHAELVAQLIPSYQAVPSNLLS